MKLNLFVSIVVFLTILFSNGILFFIATQINHNLSQFGIFLFLGGMLVVFPAMNLKLYLGFICTIISGLLLDSTFPIPFGTCTIVLLFFHIFVYLNRHRIRGENTWHATLVALIANTVIYATITMMAMRSETAQLDMTSRLPLEFIASEVIILIINPWFFDLQRSLLHWFHVDLAADDLING